LTFAFYSLYWRINSEYEVFMTAQASATHPSSSSVGHPFRGAGAREAVETLLRARKLDRTLTTTLPGLPGADLPEEMLMPLDLTALDARLAGGLPRGQLSEVVGPASSGRTSLVWAWLGAATRRGECVALVDTFDRFDPASGAACGIELSRLLWVRGQAISKTAGAVDPAWLPGVRTVHGPGTLLERTIDRALKGLNLILQSGVCTAVALDLADVPAPTLGRIPATTWLRVQRVIEGSDTACVILGPTPISRSAGGITINTSDQSQGAYGSPKRPDGHEGGRAKWTGAHDRARRLMGLSVSARLMSPRRRVAGSVAIDARADTSI
jgi:hypothetical protein